MKPRYLRNNKTPNANNCIDPAIVAASSVVSGMFRPEN